MCFDNFGAKFQDPIAPTSSYITPHAPPPCSHHFLLTQSFPFYNSTFFSPPYLKISKQHSFINTVPFLPLTLSSHLSFYLSSLLHCLPLSSSSSLIALLSLHLSLTPNQTLDSFSPQSSPHSPFLAAPSPPFSPTPS